MTHAPRQLGPILVVEDDPDLILFLGELLTSAGYRVAAVDSTLGTAALIRRERPAAILLDLGLPYRSGVSLLAELKAQPDTTAIPVIIPKKCRKPCRRSKIICGKISRRWTSRSSRRCSKPPPKSWAA